MIALFYPLLISELPLFLLSFKFQASEYTYLPIQSRRVVVIVGVPFIPTDHPKVQLKIQYNKSAALTSSTSSMQVGFVL